MNASVAIVQRILPHYRAAFFASLHERLKDYGIALTLYYGQERVGTVPRSIALDVPWSVRLNNRYLSIGDTELIWQPCLLRLQRFDMIVVEQANRLLINHLLQLKRRWSNQKLAYWGHGRNLQAGQQKNVREKFKQWRTCDVDWWFAYTELTRVHLVEGGFPSERITTVNNTIDISGLRKALAACKSDAVLRIKAELAIGGGPVGLYCGGLYADKRIDFLLDAVRVVQAVIPDFHMIVVGEGPESDRIAAASKSADWIHYVGPVYGDDRAPFLKLSDILLMPGAVGLVVIDSFVAETPLVTTRINTHGPEIAYLKSGENGVMSEDSLADYADAVIATLTGDTLPNLRAGCRTGADEYSLEHMVARFSDGIVNCLNN